MLSSTLLSAPLLSLLLACSGAESPPTPVSPAPSVSAPAPAPAAAPAVQGELDVATLKARMEAGPLPIVDVRTVEEFAQGHVAGAVNIPLSDLKGRLSELEAYKGEEIAVICAVGGRSARATQYLQTEGYSGAINVTGGTKAWVQAGYPTE